MYYQLKITDEQRMAAYKLASFRFKGRGNSTDGSFEMRYCGKLGEIVFADMMNLPRPTHQDFDHGIDFTINDVRIDLKTMARTSYYIESFVNNILASQVRGKAYLTDVYLFASIHKKERVMQIIGWISKGDVLAERSGVKFIPRGCPRLRRDGSVLDARADMYEVRARALTQFTGPDLFFDAMRRHGKTAR